MKTAEHGSVSGPMVVALSVGVLVFALVLVIIFSAASAKTYGAQTEANLQAAQQDSRNVLAQAGQKIREAAQVPKMYAEDVERVTNAAVEGRYGNEGSKATFQVLQEQNPKLDPSIYGKVYQIIEGSRLDFEVAQRRQIDIHRQYVGALGSSWRGYWLEKTGYPKQDLSTFGIISTAEADKAFETKQEEGPIQLR